MRLELSAFVEPDLEAIADHIAADNPRRAVTFIDDVRDKFALIQRNPLLYQLRPDIGADARLVALKNYVILFRIVGVDCVRIERVTHGTRDLPGLLED